MIDWSNAPEGATHRRGSTFYKRRDGFWWFYGKNCEMWLPCLMFELRNISESSLTPRPTTD